MHRPLLLLAFAIASSPSAAQEGAPSSRVQRDADNPLRVILEAGKLKSRKAAEPERAARVPERVPVRARAVADAAPPNAAPPASAAVPAAGPKPAEPAPATPAAEPELPAAVPRAALAAEPTFELALEPLRVAHKVDPVLPRRLADRVRGEVEVVVAFTVRPDGSVQEPVVQSSTHPAVNPVMLEAVAKWRYGPIPAPREHAVRLVMRAEN